MIGTKKAPRRVGFQLLDWERGETPGPWRMTVFPTWHCNLKCKICDKTWGGNPREQFNEMSEERWIKLIDEAAELGVTHICIGGGGEPLLRHDLILAMCERIRHHGLTGLLQTNGTRFKDGALQKLVDIGWTSLSISIDGSNAEINDEVRYQKNFERVIAAIEKLNACKQASRSAAPALQVATVITKLTADDLEGMVEFAHGLGAERIHFLNLIPYNEHIAKLSISEAQREALPEKAARALERTNAYAMGTNLTDFLDGGYARQGFEFPEPCGSGEQIPLVESACFEPWLNLQVLPSGLVSSCCVFWDDDADSIREQSLQDVWMGPYMSAMRERFLDNKPHPKCAKCEINNIHDNAEARREFKLVRNAGDMFSFAPANLMRKAVSSLKKHGVSGSIRRGNEWLKLRGAYRGS